MRILLSTKTYPPVINNGTNMLHDIAVYLQSKGHEVRVLHLDLSTAQSYTYDGIRVFGAAKGELQWLWAEVYITHLYATNETIARAGKKAVYHIVHSETPASYLNLLKNLPWNHKVIYNSEYLKEHFRFNAPAIVVNPPTSIAKYNVNNDPFNSAYITLINMCEAKGGKLFYEIAKRLPNHQFMAVLGSKGDAPQIIQNLPNVKIVANSPDIQSVYKETRLLLDFFVAESWGKVITEAMCNGIPVISIMRPGICENVGDAGIYIKNREDIDEWVEAIQKYNKINLRKKDYLEKSEQCRNRAKELYELNQKQLAAFDNLIKGFSGDWLDSPHAIEARDKFTKYHKAITQLNNTPRPVFRTPEKQD